MNHKKDSLEAYEFIQPIVSVIKDKTDFRVLQYSEIKDKDIDKTDKIILSGANLKDNRFIDDIDKFSWITNYDKPMLGICAGMEIIALVFGSTLKPCTEIGLVEVNTKKKNSLFSGKFNAYSLHSYSVIPSTNFDILAESKNCVHAIKHKTKDIYGLMFHPEVKNKDIFEKFVKN
ncbi:MAG: hypothetical protein K0B02_01040 [DPANN group archaeon]|nr:hypothetical protein [DPANN group archaeon]